LSLHRQFGAGTDSEAMAHASVQANLSESPGMASRRRVEAESSPDAAAAARDAHATQSDVGARRMSFQEYVKQQKHVPQSRSTKTGNEQLNFRVSLLERRMPEHSRRARSVSLPAPQPAVLAWADDRRRPSLRMLYDKQDHRARPITQQQQQRTRSFYESPLLVQTLLLQSEASTVDKSLPPMPATGRSMSQGADEDMEDRALFSTLLGDGAALTPPDVVVARRQSGVLAPSQGAPWSLDPAIAFDAPSDGGEHNVPESVLRAYMAGDITAVERYFQYIMHLTAPSSVYDGEVSEDGDWTYGLEGVPPEVKAQRAAAAAKAIESRDLPDMVDASAEASRILGSGFNLRGARASDTAIQPAPVAVADSPVSELPASVHDDPVDLTAFVQENSAKHPFPVQDRSVSQPSPVQEYPTRQTDSVREYPVREVPVEQPPAAVARTPTRQSPAATSVNSGAKGARKIAVPRSRMGRDTHAGKQHSIRALKPLPHPASPISTQLPGDSVKEQIAPMVALSSADTQPVIDIPVTVESTRGRRPANSEDVPCFSPGRNPHRRQSEPMSQRKPLPTQTVETKRQEKQMLMARLRVLEGMIQKTAIEEARLQPAPVLQGSRLTEDIQSLESFYSSNMDLDYDRIGQELSSSVRQRFDNRRVTRDTQSNVIQAPRMHEPVAAEQVRAGGNRGADVLKRLKHGSQARARSPFRTSMFERAGVTPVELSVASAIDRPAEQDWSKMAEPATSASIPHAQNMSLSDVAYSARSSGSFPVELVRDQSIPGSPTSDVTSSHRTVRVSNTSRFRRTARLLAL
ncbi:hypothetical protein IWW50_003711, partial [Coemansia erecta]